jgi:hypothetical protein
MESKSAGRLNIKKTRGEDHSIIVDPVSEQMKGLDQGPFPVPPPKNTYTQYST